MIGRSALRSFSFLYRTCEIHKACSFANPRRAAWRLFRQRKISLSVERVSTEVRRACCAHNYIPERRHRQPVVVSLSAVPCSVYVNGARGACRLLFAALVAVLISARFCRLRVTQWKGNFPGPTKPDGR